MRAPDELRLGEAPGLVFLAKPAGLPVFPPHREPAGDCLLARWLPFAGSGPWPPGFEGGLAHRLDTPTSGVVLAATDPTSLAELRAAFAAGSLQKHYVFASSGRPGWLARGPRVVEVPLAHHPHHEDRMIARRRPDTGHRGPWLPTWTCFAALGQGLVTAEIRTGVTHQIRAHAALLGVALDGDIRYGGAPASFGDFRLHHFAVRGPGWASPVWWPTWAGPVPEAWAA